MYAIVKTGGKQYRVAAGTELNVEKLPGRAGDKVLLPVVALVDGATVKAQAADLADYSAAATIVEQTKGEKQFVFKFKKRKNYKKMQGHRQKLTRVRIDEIGAGLTVPESSAQDDDELNAPAAAPASDAEATDDELDERESEAALKASAEAKELDKADADVSEERSGELDDLENDINMADISYEAAADEPAQD